MQNPISVAQLNRQARFILEEHFQTVWVSGEVSNLARPRSGHIYFSLKDDDAQVRCAFFRSQAMRATTPLADGDAILVRGRLSLYEGRGDYQIIVSSVQPTGEGALQLAFAALKRKLDAEGLFAAEHKRALPERINRLAVVTSAQAAALQDVLTVLARRDPALAVDVYPCLVQGTAAPASIRQALARAAADPDADAILLTRGGGSAEDLWAFNDETLARDLFACRKPVVSAVGHEVDFTIADLIADLRAPTPSAAAELLSSDRFIDQRQLQQLSAQLINHLRALVARRQTTLDHLSARLRHPGERIREQQQRLDERELRLMRANRTHLQGQSLRLRHLKKRLQQAAPARELQGYQRQVQTLQHALAQQVRQTLVRAHQSLSSQGHALHTASPLATLERGYSVTFHKARGHLVRSTRDVSPGDELTHRLVDGELTTRVLHRHDLPAPGPDPSHESATADPNSSR